VTSNILRHFLLCKHPLFRTLQSHHKGDQYVKCFKTSPSFGPRQPWHDIHSAVRGPEAIHLVKAFEERWTKQADAADLVSLTRLGLDNAFDGVGFNGVEIGVDGVEIEKKGGWCTQLSRSIDSRVNQFDPNMTKAAVQEFINDSSINWKQIQEKNTKLSKRIETATTSPLSYSRCLDMKKGRLVDSSIHTTNIHQIRRAEHFIYIESQYFMGSSFMWENNRSVKCGNMIAAEVRKHTTIVFHLFSPYG
jgi:phospholipase D1/2